MELDPIGVIRSTIKERRNAPKQGSEGAPDAWLEVHPRAAQGLDGIAAGDEIIVITWLHRAQRDVLKVTQNRLRIGPIEAIDGTPVIDIKPLLCEIQKERVR
jgi:tRNA (Thr-GGU) A37 N-methylase